MNASQKTTATQSQKLMIFVLTMSLYGLATLFTELIPKFWWNSRWNIFCSSPSPWPCCSTH